MGMLKHEDGAESRSSLSDLTRGAIVPSLVLFALPLLGSSVAQQLYGTVDLLFVGNVVGATALAALGVSTLLITCLIGFFNGLSVGASVVVARFLGAGDAERVERAVGCAVALGLVGGIVMAVVGILIAPLYLAWMSTPAEVLAPALTYLRVYMASMLAVVMYNQCSGVLRGLRDSRTPLLAQVAGGLVNIAMNAFFLLVMGLGVEGSALATLFSQGIAAVICLVRLARMRLADGAVALRVKSVRLHPRTLCRILVIGAPAGLQALMITLSNVFVQHQINLLGTESIAAFSAYFKVELPIYYAIVSLGQAATTFVAQNHAAGRERRARWGTRWCLLLGVGASVVLAGLLMALGNQVFCIFSRDVRVIALGVQIIHVTFPFYWLYVFMEVFAAALRGRGSSVAPMVVFTACLFGVRTLLLYLFTLDGVTVQAVASVYPATWAVTALAMTIGYAALVLRRSRWGTVRIGSLRFERDL